MSLFGWLAALVNATGITIPYHRYHAWVIPGVLMRGSRPNAREWAELEALGIKSAINLEAESLDVSPFPEQHLMVKDGEALTPDQIGYGIAWLADPKHWPCFVHCRAGQGRTGILTECFLIYRGATLEQAHAAQEPYGALGGDQLAAVVRYSDSLVRPA